MKCQTPDCKNEAAKKRHFCQTCATRKYRLKYPLKYLYTYQRTNALRRGKIHTLTYDEFIEFCKHTNYDKLKGIYANCLSIDCRIPELGYTKDNIRAITVSDNSKLARGSISVPGFEYTNDVPF